jgi:Ca2+-binding EF-hand superfamily protein
MANELTLQQIEETKKVFDIYRMHDEKPLDQAVLLQKDLYSALLDLHFEISFDEIKEFIKKMDLKEQINFLTFMNICAIKFREKDFSKDVTNAFKSFDKTNKDYFTYEELKAIITDHGPKISSEAADELMKELGLESNKKFNYGDFVNFNL